MRKYAENTGDFNANNKEFFSKFALQKSHKIHPFEEVTQSDSSGVSHKWEKVFARGNLLAYQDFFLQLIRTFVF